YNDNIVVGHAFVAPAQAGAQGRGVANGTAVSLDSGSPLCFVRHDGDLRGDWRFGGGRRMTDGFVDDYLSYLLARASHLVSRDFH
ncbi:hypothetical protein ABTM67_20020, partial [Acinetobacter baumannii]